MYSHRSTTLCVSAVLLSIGLIAWQTRAADPESASGHDFTVSDSNRFEGKFLIIRMDRSLDEKSAYLQQVHLEKIGGEPFLVGKGISLSPERKSYEGRTIWVSIHHIEQMYEFNNLEEINKMYEKKDD